MSMESLIPIMNKLHDVFNVVGTNSIQLPQIVVIGSQSSGKSSVLESLVGRDFLPRGTGIITRCPLVLQLIYTPEDSFFHSTNDAPLQVQEWGMFLHTGEKIFSDFREIRKEIVAETERKSGSNKGISSEAISLKIFSPHVVNLTLVDLPGITKVPVGDQPKDIEMQVKRLILQYISNPNAIILAVTAANTDFATSEAMKFARECDPGGKRTLAVITKLDLMDRGTNATDVLCGRVIPVKLGIIGIVNRSQQDINDDKNIKDALKDEALFFEKNYPVLAARNGTRYLRKILNKLLINHIRDSLPDLKTRVSSMIVQYQSLLQSYGNIVTDQNRLFLEIITQFTSSYCSTIEGTAKNIETSELSGGARISYIFHEIFGGTLSRIDPLGGLSTLDILTAIRNATGTRPTFFVPVAAFELLVKRQIERLEEPSLRCVELVYEEMQRIVRHCGAEFKQDIRRFPKLYEKTLDVVTQILQQRLPVTNEMVRNLILIELAYINSRHPDFHNISALLDGIEKHKEDKSTDKIHLKNGSSEAEFQINSISGDKSEAEFQINSISGDKSEAEFQINSISGDKSEAEFQINSISGDKSEAEFQINSFSGDKSELETKTSKLFDMIRNAKKYPTGSDIPAEQNREESVSDLSANESPSFLKPISKPRQYKIGDGVTDKGYAFQQLNLFSSTESLYATEISNNARNLTAIESKVCKIIKHLICSYFTIVKKNIQDSVPKAIMHFLVNHVKDNLQNELIFHLYKAEEFSSLLRESEQITSGRTEATEMLKLLQKSNDIISEIKETSS